MEQREQIDQKAPVTRTRKRPFFLRLSFWLFVALLVVGYLYYTKTHKPEANPLAQAGYTEEELERVMGEMKSSVVASADDEIKILGIIDDPSSLKKEQPFYKDVQKGDYVFVFTGSSRALIWRPESKQIVNFGVFEVRNEEATTPQAQTPAPKQAAEEKEEE